MNKLKTRKSANHPHGKRLSVLNHNIVIMILIVIITMTGCSLVAAVAGIASAVSENNENTNAKTNENTNAKNQSRSAKTNKNANAKDNESVNANKQPGTNSSQPLSPYLEDPYFSSDPFCSAIIKGQTNDVKRQLAAGANVNAMLKHRTPIHIAAAAGHADIVKVLIDAGADVNKSDYLAESQLTPLHIAVAAGHADAAKVLIAAGANVNNAYNNYHSTPLHLAAAAGHADAAKVLIVAGADINAKQGQGTTPLHIAASRGHADIVKVLIDAGADVNSEATALTPLYLAASMGHADIVKVLIDAGADVNAKVLYGAGANVDAKTIDVMEDQTPLHAAALQGHADAAKVLIAAGADVNAKSIKNETPLHYAALEGHADIVTALIEAGADISAMDTAHKTPIYLAKNDDIVKELRRAVNSKMDFETNNKDSETSLNNFRTQIDTCADLGKPTREIVEEFITNRMLLCEEPHKPSNSRRQEIIQECNLKLRSICPTENREFSPSRDEYNGYYELFKKFCYDYKLDINKHNSQNIDRALSKISKEAVINNYTPAGCSSTGVDNYYISSCFDNATIPDVLGIIKQIQDPDSEIRRNVEKRKRSKAYIDEVERMYQEISNNFDNSRKSRIAICERNILLNYNESQQLAIIYDYCNGDAAAVAGGICLDTAKQVIRGENNNCPSLNYMCSGEACNQYPYHRLKSFAECLNKFEIVERDYVTSSAYFEERIQKILDANAEQIKELRNNMKASGARAIQNYFYWNSPRGKCETRCNKEYKKNTSKWEACMDVCKDKRSDILE